MAFGLLLHFFDQIFHYRLAGAAEFMDATVDRADAEFHT
jgi:hypothetical protein